MTPSATDPLIGRTIDQRYLIEDRIARGGMASVYRGLDYRLERPIAVKIMHPHLAEDEQFTARFIQEARQAARLAHPNIVNVFDQGQDGPLTFIVMEYLPGITLRELLRDFGVLTWEQTIDVVKAILQGLDAAHQAGIVHRDLKPENILMADDGRIKIADFGLARAASHNTQTGQALLGTVAYLSPELVTGTPADIRSDLYALGIMIFEMLTGKQPFTGDQAVTVAYQHANGSVPVPSDLAPEIPSELDELVRWSTQRNPDDRPPHAKALLDQVIRVEKELRKRRASAEPTEAISTPDIDATRVMATDTADDEPTEVLSRTDDVFAGLETPDYAAEQPAPTITTMRKGPGVGLWTFFILAAAAAIFAGWWVFQPQGPTLVTVPDVQGLTVDQAGQSLRGVGLVVEEALQQNYDDEIPAGLVISSTPEAGSEVEEQTSVSLIVSQGVEPAVMPALIGLSAADAETRITDARLIGGDVSYEYSDTAAKDTVTSATNSEGTTIAPGTELEPDTAINLVVSAGSLPSVQGLTVEEAKAALDEAGLVGVVGGDGQFSDEIAEGLVIEFRVPNNATPRPGDTVTLTVSRGPELVTIPDVIDETIADAIAALERLELEVDVRSEFPEESWDESFARVTSLEPGQGQQVPKGTVIIIRSFV